jgi:hypothetical protein
MINTIDDVIAHLRAIGDSVGPGGGVDEFSAVYQRTPESIRDRLAEGF